jgi:molecular chaperone DnaJ
MFGDLFGGGGRAAAAAPPRRAPTSRPRPTIGFTDAIEGVTISAAADQRRALPDLPRHRRQARHAAAHLPECEGAGFVQPSTPAARSRSTRPAPSAAAASWCTTTRARPATAPAAALSPARSRPASRPASRTASGSGSRARARPARTAARRRPLRHRQGHAAPAVRPQGRQPHPRRAGLLRRGGARRRDQGPDPRRRPGHAQDPGRHAQRPHLPGPRQGRAAKGRHQGDLLVTVEVQVPAVLDASAREAVEAYRAATAGTPLRTSSSRRP